MLGLALSTSASPLSERTGFRVTTGNLEHLSFTIDDAITPDNPLALRILDVPLAIVMVG